jgi:hypothetical protein
VFYQIQVSRPCPGSRVCVVLDSAEAIPYSFIGVIDQKGTNEVYALKLCVKNVAVLFYTVDDLVLECNPVLMALHDVRFCTGIWRASLVEAGSGAGAVQ